MVCDFVLNILYCHLFIIMRHPVIPTTISVDPFVENASKSALSLHKRAADLHTDWHVHSKGQLLYAEEGVTRLYTSNSSILLPSRHCAWIPADCIHQVSSSSPNLFLRTLYFSIPPCHENSFYTELSVFQVNDLLREMIVYTERWANSLIADKEESSFMESLRLILPDLQGASLGLKLPASRHPKVQLIMNILLENLSERITLEEVAANTGVSTRTVSRLFQQDLGMSFTGFLKVARMIRALELLNQPGASVTETAFAVGYDSVPTFSNSFLEVVGSRPQAFLQKK